jgi:tetratricopeptide (TPR) repeat protein
MAVSSRLLLCLLLAGCSSRKPTVSAQVEPFPWPVEHAGCAQVRPDGRCELDPDGVLRVWVPVASSVELQLWADGQRLTVTPTMIQQGQRFELTFERIPALLELRTRYEGQKLFHRISLGPATPRVPIVEAKALRRAGKMAEAKALLEPLAAKDGPMQTAARSVLARMCLFGDEIPRGISELNQTTRAHRSQGRLTDALNDFTTLAYAQMAYQQDYAGARATLEEAMKLAPLAEGQTTVTYFLGLLGSLTGDNLTALRLFRESNERATRLGMLEVMRDARYELGKVFQTLGRWDEAYETLQSAATVPAVASSPCGDVDSLADLAWLTVLAREAGSPSAARFPKPLPIMSKAYALVDSGACPDSSRKAMMEVNLSIAALQETDLPLARSWLEKARPLRSRLLSYEGLWLLELEGRIALAGGKSAEALAAFERLGRLGAASDLTETQWRSALWRARTYVQRQAVEPALLAYAEAEALLARWALRVPLTEGRDVFMSQHDKSSTERLELLFSKGRYAEALETVRLARSRALMSAYRARTLEALPPVQRARWDAAIGRYHAGRQELEAQANDDWKLSAERLAQAALARTSRKQLLNHDLDEAFAALGARSSSAEPLRAPEEGELFLAYTPTEVGAIALASNGKSSWGKKVTLGGTGDELAAALLGPFDELLGSARRVRIFASGAVGEIDFHALRWREAPLLEHASVEYGLDLPTRHTAANATSGEIFALVVANPHGDLPSATAEAKQVSEALSPAGVTVLLDGDRASRDRVLSLLGKVRLFHYAGHGIFRGQGGWESAMPLAGHGELSVGDILALPQVPEHVVLSGCDTGRSNRERSIEGMGLAHAFLASGSQSVVAATRPVSDALAQQLVHAMYRFGAATAPVEALRNAQLLLSKQRPEVDWAAFRIVVP